MRNAHAERALAPVSGAADAVLDALPHPVITVAPTGLIVNANSAAEAFFDSSAHVLRRHRIHEIVPFGSPLIALIEQVRARSAAVNEYRVDLGTPRNGGERIVDIHVGPMAENPQQVVVMLQERTMADKIDRQLTHRGAARSVTALASMLAHEIKNPLSGIRGAAQLLEQSADDRRPRADAPDLRRSRPHREARRPHGGIFRRAADRARCRQHSCGARACEALAASGFASRIKIVEEYDPSLPPVFANRDQLVQVFLNLMKNAAEAIGGADGEIHFEYRRSGPACG
jgi:two-component system nitrogen regulation sensor histidine kinase GlnL